MAKPKAKPEPQPTPEPDHFQVMLREKIALDERYDAAKDWLKRREDLRIALKERWQAERRNAPWETDGYQVEFVTQSKTYTKPCAGCPGQADKRFELHYKLRRMVPVTDAT
jgi:hypothetical protein